MAEKSDPDFPHKAWWYDPFEILAVLYLRTLAGLVNPVLAHPLLATPIGVLPAAAPVYHDDLLEAVIRQANKERPALLDTAARQ